MQHEKDEWLEQKIEEDLDAWAKERQRMLMEAEELQSIHVSENNREQIHRKWKEQNRRLLGRKRMRILIAAAAAMTVLLGMGMIGSGKKNYEPEISPETRGDEINMKINHADVEASEYDEEDVCQQVEEQLGVLPLRFKYRPSEMALTWYEINEDIGEAIMEYSMGEHLLHVLIFEKNSDSSIRTQYDGTLLDTVMLESCGEEVDVYAIEGSPQGSYCGASFEYLDSYYEVSSDIDQETFEKIMENILIKSE